MSITEIVFLFFLSMYFFIAIIVFVAASNTKAFKNGNFNFKTTVFVNSLLWVILLGAVYKHNKRIDNDHRV